MSSIALVGDVDGGVLRAAGWQVRGALLAMPYDDPGELASYASVEELLEDDLDAVCLDGGDLLLARGLPALRTAGRHVLLPTAAPLDLELLRSARAVDSRAEVAVALRERWEPWALTTAAALQVIDSPVVQATVRGWPRGLAAACELVDLAQAWCGEVLAVVAAPAPLPAAELGPGLPVAWSLLHASGATVLVSHEGAPVLARLSFSTARLEAGPLGARWEGGAELPLLPTPDRREMPNPGPPPPGTAPGLLASAVHLLELARGDAPAAQWPWAADLGDLQSVSRVLAALRESARCEALVRVG